MAKPNYQHEKRARELAKKQKKEEKLKRKQERAAGEGGEEGAEAAEGEETAGDAPQTDAEVAPSDAGAPKG